MVTIPKKPQSRAVVSQAATPRNIGVSNLPGAEAFGAVGAQVLAQNADVMKSLAQEEIRQIEQAATLKFRTELADFQIETLQRTDEIDADRDPNVSLMDATMEDFQKRSGELVERQPEFLKAEAQTRLLPLQVQSARSAIALQTQRNQQARNEAIENFTTNTVNAILHTGQNAEQTAANIESFVAALPEEEQEAALEFITPRTQKADLDVKVSTFQTPEQMATAAQQLSDIDGPFGAIAPTTRFSVIQKLKQNEAKLRAEPAVQRQKFLEKVVEDGGEAVVQVAPYADGFEEAVAQSGSQELQEQLNNINENLIGTQRNQAISQMVQMSREAADLVYDTQGTPQQSRTYIPKAEAVRVNDMLIGAIAEGDAGVIDSTMSSIIERYEQYGMSESEIFNELHRAGGLNSDITSITLSTLENRRQTGEDFASVMAGVQELSEGAEGITVFRELFRTETQPARGGQGDTRITATQGETVAMNAINPFISEMRVFAARNGADVTEVNNRVGAMSELMFSMVSSSLAPLNGAPTEANIETAAQQAAAQLQSALLGDSTIVTEGNTAVSMKDRHVAIGGPAVLDAFIDGINPDDLIIQGGAASLGGFSQEGLQEAPSRTVKRGSGVSRSLQNIAGVSPGKDRGSEPRLLRSVQDLAGDVPQGPSELQEAIRAQAGFVMAPNGVDYMLTVRSATGDVQLVPRKTKRTEITPRVETKGTKGPFGQSITDGGPRTEVTTREVDATQPIIIKASDFDELTGFLFTPTTKVEKAGDFVFGTEGKIRGDDIDNAARFLRDRVFRDE